MRNGAILAVVAGISLVNGLHLDYIPVWRQLLFVVVAVVAYLHGRHLPVRRDWLVLGTVAIPGVVALGVDLWDGVGALMSLGLFAVLPWLAGRFRRQQAELVEAGRQRVGQLEREQQYTAERVKLHERARIASDMHDSLGHELALIALRAGALELAADMSEANREAAAQLRVSAVTATDRLRRTVGLLRDSGSATTDPPDESIEALVERAVRAGMAVTLRRDERSAILPPLLDRAAHRVTQESLTNAARYAPGAEVQVTIEHNAGTLTVTVTNAPPPTEPALADDDAKRGSVPVGGRDGGRPVRVGDHSGRPVPSPGGGAVPNGAGGGTGLASLRERVRLLGGTLQAGPTGAAAPNVAPHIGGFAVTARFPWRPSDTGESA
ncbi:histidine kinase [Nonomuraea sp. NPDC049141]|uniref:sensor histidine kinase n=1 Tax=Nonomuraea sp. NPDC049141 TaxID=3155500 RepID=UPI0033EACAB5